MRNVRIEGLFEGSLPPENTAKPCATSNETCSAWIVISEGTEIQEMI